MWRQVGTGTWQLGGGGRQLWQGHTKSCRARSNLRGVSRIALPARGRHSPMCVLARLPLDHAISHCCPSLQDEDGTLRCVDRSRKAVAPAPICGFELSRSGELMAAVTPDGAWVGRCRLAGHVGLVTPCMPFPGSEACVAPVQGTGALTPPIRFAHQLGLSACCRRPAGD